MRWGTGPSRRPTGLMCTLVPARKGAFVRILHLIRRLDDRRALAVAAAQAQAHQVTIVLLHDAVAGWQVSLPNVTVWAGRADVEARGIAPPWPLIDYEGIVELIENHDKVISW